MTKLCLECTKRYYFDTYTQNFPGEACPGSPSWAWLYHAGTPPPRSTSGHGPGRVRRGRAGLYPAESLSVLYHKCHCLFKLLDVLDPSGSCRTSPQVDADASRLIPGSAAKNSIHSLLGSLKPPVGTERDPVQKPTKEVAERHRAHLMVCNIQVIRTMN